MGGDICTSCADHKFPDEGFIREDRTNLNASTNFNMNPF